MFLLRRATGESRTQPAGPGHGEGDQTDASREAKAEELVSDPYLPEELPVYIARRASGDHPTVSTTEAILVDEVAEIGANWCDLTLYSSEAALDALLEGPCPACPPDQWTAVSKDLETLVP